MAEKPDYVASYVKPINTEIKHINGHWYLYERSNVYDPKIRRSRKKSGKCLGKITESGFVPSRTREPKAFVPYDTVEVGASEYFIQRSNEMRSRLQLYFPDLWEKIYAVALLRTIYDPAFRRLPVHYENSIISYLYPDLNFSAPAITAFLKELGGRRGSIRGYMKDSIEEGNKYIIFDGHRMLSASKTMENAEIGYDSKMRYKPQINLMYAFLLGEGTGTPAYYKQYIGSTPDITAFIDILKESGISCAEYTLIADKGFAGNDDIALIEECGMKYIIPLKRGNLHVKGKVPVSPAGYEKAFNFNGRAIQCMSFPEDDCQIHLFLDMELLSDEYADLTMRTEKHNNTVERKREKELKRRAANKGRLTDEQLAELRPISVSEMCSGRAEMGTITIKTNRKDLNSFQVYSIYKQRQKIEQFFKTYADTLDYDASYMRNNHSEEAWLFLNHLSAILGVSAIEEIASIGQEKNISLKDLIQTLSKIQAAHSEDHWSIAPSKRAVNQLCSKLDIDMTTPLVFQMLP